MDPEKLVKEMFLKRIAGEIVLSDNPGKTIQKWRNIFRVPQRKLAEEMGVMPSVISDYESGRRKSPGIKIIKKIVQTLIEIDERSGGNIIKYFSHFPSETVLSDAVIDLKEFVKPIPIAEFCSAIKAEIVVRNDLSDRDIYGYTIIDSLKAIVDLPPLEFVKLYGLTTERALIFTEIKRGRSPMVAIKVTNLRPGLVVYHGKVEKIDELAIRIAETEGIPVALCRNLPIEKVIDILHKKFG
jgi:putative transcriptional regulator